ncbi:unnamed protein product [Rhizophagus irregularis]|nr:unnamed protein product [Rhizophagus irregularis]
MWMDYHEKLQRKQARIDGKNFQLIYNVQVPSSHIVTSLYPPQISKHQTYILWVLSSSKLQEMKLKGMNLTQISGTLRTVHLINIWTESKTNQEIAKKWKNGQIVRTGTISEETFGIETSKKRNQENYYEKLQRKQARIDGRNFQLIYNVQVPSSHIVTPYYPPQIPKH